MIKLIMKFLNNFYIASMRTAHAEMSGKRGLGPVVRRGTGAAPCWGFRGGQSSLEASPGIWRKHDKNQTFAMTLIPFRP